MVDLLELFVLINDLYTMFILLFCMCFSFGSKVAVD